MRERERERERGGGEREREREGGGGGVREDCLEEEVRRDMLRNQTKQNKKYNG